MSDIFKPPRKFKKSSYFFEKKVTKKLLVLWALAPPTPTGIRSFLLLFFKKEALAYLPVFE
jgi:hypothetical protein